MKAARAARPQMAPSPRRRPRARDETAGAEVIGAIILFGLFVTTIAFLNLTAVPNAGLAAEEEHWEGVLAAMNDLQTSAEAAAIPGKEGATVAGSFTLGPPHRQGHDFFSFFLATPARASGQLTLVANHGNVSVSHNRTGAPDPVYDVGSAAAAFPYGRLTFDPHANFRQAGILQLESGGAVTTTSTDEAMRFAPPVSVSVANGTTSVSIMVRVLNGTDFDVGGIAPVRVGLRAEAATLVSPAAANAVNATLRIETAHGSAWGAYLNATAEGAGLGSPAQYRTLVLEGQGADGLDVVVWTVEGLGGPGNDVRLTSGLGVYAVSVS